MTTPEQGYLLNALEVNRRIAANTLDTLKCRKAPRVDILHAELCLEYVLKALNDEIARQEHGK